MPNNTPTLLFKTWVQAVATHQKCVGKLVGLYPHFLPTIKLPANKWVVLSKINPHQYTPLFPTHFSYITPVNLGFSTLSTPPIMNSNKGNIMNNKGARWV